MGKYTGASKVTMKRAFLNQFLGKHVVEVQAVRDGENFDGDPYHATDLVIHFSSNTDVADGLEVVHLVKQGQHKGKRETYLREVMEVVSAQFGHVNPGDVSEDELEAAVGAEQPTVGVWMEATVYQVRTKKGHTINKSRFRFLGNDEDEAAKSLADAVGE